MVVLVDNDDDDGCNCVCCWQKTTQFASHLYISYNRQPFKRCFFPNNAHPAVRTNHIWTTLASVVDTSLHGSNPQVGKLFHCRCSDDKSITVIQGMTCLLYTSDAADE